jgi:hypothetical protein
MPSKLILVNTFESNETRQPVIAAINGNNNDAVQDMYGTQDDDPTGALAAMQRQWPGLSSNDMFALAETDPTFFDTLAGIWYNTYSTFYQSNYTKKTFPTDVITGCTHINKKPDGIDYMIGWVIPYYDIVDAVYHLEVHEKLTHEVAVAVVDKHNSWMKDNRHIFDLFLDRTSIEDTITQIKTFLESKNTH